MPMCVRLWLAVILEVHFPESATSPLLFRAFRVFRGQHWSPYPELGLVGAGRVVVDSLLVRWHSQAVLHTRPHFRADCRPFSRSYSWTGPGSRHTFWSGCSVGLVPLTHCRYTGTACWHVDGRVTPQRIPMRSSEFLRTIRGRHSATFPPSAIRRDGPRMATR